MKQWIGIAASAVIVMAGIVFGYLYQGGGVALCQGVTNTTVQSPPSYNVAEDYCTVGCATVGAAPIPCLGVGAGRDIRNDVFGAFKEHLHDKVKDHEKDMSRYADYFVQGFLEYIHRIEGHLIEWWDTFWWYNWRPALQQFVDQSVVAEYERGRALLSGLDVVEMNADASRSETGELSTLRAVAPSENACVVATNAGGFGRASGVSKAMRRGWEKNSRDGILNRRGSAGAQGAAAYQKNRSAIFESSFCDPNDNGGQNLCTATASPELRNADTQVTKTIYNKLTYPAADSAQGRAHANAVSEAINNMVAVPAGEVIKAAAMAGPVGNERWLQRRGVAARHAALKSVPSLVSGWRTPGSRLGEWVKQLRQEAGVPLDDISANPSYLEVMHALAVDRFNSGSYAVGTIVGEEQLEVEKLTISSLNLMQLRDYYELMERMALSLAVQVSMTAEKLPEPDVSAAGRTR